MEILSDDESAIRTKFGFTKTKPLVYKQLRDGRTVEVPIENVRLIYVDADGKIGSLLIDGPDFTDKRICSSYLKEMQQRTFTFEPDAHD